MKYLIGKAIPKDVKAGSEFVLAFSYGRQRKMAADCTRVRLMVVGLADLDN